MDQHTPASERTTVRRRSDRAVYDPAAIEAILDEGMICHVGYVIDNQPFVIPTVYARRASQIFFHGSAASRTLRALSGGIPVCLTVALCDGLVLARSAPKHSVNYRSVMVLGSAREITRREEKLLAMEAIVEHAMPGRWADVRKPSDPELAAVTVLALPITEASAKVRTGPPVDLETDHVLPVWGR